MSGSATRASSSAAADHGGGERMRIPQALQRFVRPRAIEPLPIRLHRRRIYVLPTPYGLFFALLLVAMTVGALNYNNNPALILCFLLLSLMLSCLLRGYLNLSGVQLETLDAQPVHAGQVQRLRLRFRSERRRRCEGLILQRDGQRAAFALHDGQPCEVELTRTTRRRGRAPVGRFKLFSQQPLGLFEVWSWLHPDARPLVWPALEKDPPQPPGEGGQDHPRPQRGAGDEAVTLRDYRRGDPMRQVAWKHSARAQHLLVREYEQPGGTRQDFSWDALAPLSSDARARRLARWLADAERQAQVTTLLMPDAQIGPGQGPSHLHACFKALALAP
ncbi:MAG: DUF58 domain-containing protein [Gammaproteobacteria bacterium]|nr:DUF58 domain-containing protein [Gammaproteobacteria bacterium]